MLIFSIRLIAWILDNFTCPLCGKFSWKGITHQRCKDYEQAWADSFGGYR